MKRLLLLLAVTACVSTACNSVTPYAAIVNGRVISTAEVNDELHAIASNPAYVTAIERQSGGVSQSGGFRPGGPNTVNAGYAGSVVYERVVAILIHNELLRRGLKEPDEAYKKKVDADLRSQSGAAALYDSLAANYRDQVVRVQAEVQTIQDSITTPELLHKYFTDNAAKMQKTCLLQLTVRVASADGLAAAQAKALDIRARLGAGGDFAALGKEAAGPDGAAPRTTPDCFNDYTVPAASLTILQSLKVNEFSQPLQTSGGISLVEVVSRTPLAFDAATQADIKTIIGDTGPIVTGLVAKAKIKVNPRYGDYQAAAASGSSPIAPHVPVLLDPLGTQPAARSGNDLGGLVPSTGSASGR